MSNKKQEAYKKMETKNLEKDLFSKRESLRKFRFDSSGTKTTDVKVAKNLRKDVARILTEIRTRIKA